MRAGAKQPTQAFQRCFRASAIQTALKSLGCFAPARNDGGNNKGGQRQQIYFLLPLRSTSLLDYIRFWPQPLLGLDIQADEIRLLQLQRSKKKRVIKQTLAQSLPAGAVIDGQIQAAELVSDRLQELVKSSKLPKCGVAIALPSHCVTTKRISVIKGLRESELEAEVISHLSHCFPIITEGLCYDYMTFGSNDEMQDDVLLVATSFTCLNTHVTAVQNAGLQVRVVDVDQYALTRANQLREKEGLQVEEKWLVSCGLALRVSDL